jgi:pyridoxamine 5'-phosphate oxidase-like protein
MSEVEEQRRGRRIAMSAAEVDAFLREQRTCRVATAGGDGQPHVSPLWFAWDGAALWLYSIVRSKRWNDTEVNPRVSVVVDAGHDFFELRGVELIGKVERVGEVPRVGREVAELGEPERLFAQRYFSGGAFAYDERHGWLRLRPRKVVSWDFRKIT